MKFLCVACDEPMKLEQTHSEADHTLTVVFTCPGCGWQVAMLTNPMETQMVHSLGVRIGGPTDEKSRPMATLRERLATGDRPVERAGETSPEQADPPAEQSGCPFARMVEESTQASASEFTLSWTPEAEARLARIPAFVRPMARKSIEQMAREKGLCQVDESLLDLVKDQFGM